MKYKNYYEILEVNRKSSVQDIKLNFRRLAKEYHPDKNKSAEAEDKFKDINEAYAVLMDPEKRRNRRGIPEEIRRDHDRWVSGQQPDSGDASDADFTDQSWAVQCLYGRGCEAEHLPFPPCYAPVV